jgi:hypothetical protein
MGWCGVAGVGGWKGGAALQGSRSAAPAAPPPDAVAPKPTAAPHTQDGSDARFGGHAFVACPTHDPTAPGFDAAELRSEFAARDAAHAAASAAAAGGPPPAGAPAGGDEMTAAAELLTGIRRASVDGGGFCGDAIAVVTRAPRWSASGGAKRGRSPSGDGGSDGTRAGVSDDEAARPHHHRHLEDRPHDAATAAAEGAAAAAAAVTAKRLAAAAAAAATAAWAAHTEPVDTPPATPPARPEAGDGGADGGGLPSHLQLGAAANAAARESTDGSDAEAQLGALLRAAGGGSADLEELLESAAARTAAATMPGALLGGSSGHANRPGRCAVCIVQRKGKCGTESAPKKCMRRQQALQEARAALQQRLWRQLAAGGDDKDEDEEQEEQQEEQEEEQEEEEEDADAEEGAEEGDAAMEPEAAQAGADA